MLQQVNQLYLTLHAMSMLMLRAGLCTPVYKVITLHCLTVVYFQKFVASCMNCTMKMPLFCMYWTLVCRLGCGYCRVYTCVYLYMHTSYSGSKMVKIKLAYVWYSMHWCLPVVNTQVIEGGQTDPDAATSLIQLLSLPLHVLEYSMTRIWRLRTNEYIAMHICSKVHKVKLE